MIEKVPVLRLYKRMTIRWQRTDEIFNEAMNRPPADRRAFLAEACGDDADLRREVESLLDYVSDSEGYLQSLVDETMRELRASLPFAPGAHVGPYVILHEI